MRVDIDQATSIIQQGGLVAFPTETVYGLGALATHHDAVDLIYQTKDRPSDNPLICHFASAGQIKQYATNIPDYRDVLVSHFSPGPVSYLLDCKDDRLTYVTRGSSKVLCRVPNHPLTLQLLESLDGPLVGPSANPSGQPSATNASMVLDYFGDKVHVLDGGSSFIGLESTIIDCTQEDRIVILRPGQVDIASIGLALSRAGYDIPVTMQHEHHDMTIPGSKYRHYSPKTIIYKVTEWDPVHDRPDVALIGPTERLDRIETSSIVHRIDLGSVYSPSMIAHDLYSKLHELDALGVRHAYLFMWKLGNNGIEQAITNRLDKIGERRNS